MGLCVQEAKYTPRGSFYLEFDMVLSAQRRPDGTLLKYKSCICADDSMQGQGRDLTESYAPVVQWSSV